VGERGADYEAPSWLELRVSELWPWFLVIAVPVAVATGSLWPIALVVLVPLVLRGWRMRHGRQLAVYREIRLGVALEAIAAALTVMALAVAILSLDVPLLGWGWYSLVAEATGDQAGATNIVVVPLEIPLLAVPFVALLVFLLPDLAAAEERIFRVGTRGWLDGLRRSVAFGAAHLIMGIPLGAVVPLTLAGVWLTWHYFRGGQRESTRYHLAYNLVLVTVATVVLVVPGLIGWG
jgi:hypothetical protein